MEEQTGCSGIVDKHVSCLCVQAHLFARVYVCEPDMSEFSLQSSLNQVKMKKPAFQYLKYIHLFLVIKNIVLL